MSSTAANLNFHSEDISFSLPNPSACKAWAKKCIGLENKQLGEVNVVFCSDQYLLKLNQQYLNHDTYTDIITFDYVEGEIISGDLFISIERVKENAQKASLTFANELNRVIIHGLLHLMGYNDKTKQETQEIRAKEDFYLTLQP